MLGRPKKVIEAQAELAKRNIAHTVLHTTVPYGRVRDWLKRDGNKWILDCPIPDDIKMPMYALEQTGLYVISTLKSHLAAAGKLSANGKAEGKKPKHCPPDDMHAIGEWLSPAELARKLNKISRLPVDTAHVTRAEFDSLEFHDRLTVRWDAWNQLMTGEFQNEYEDYAKRVKSTNTGVDQWTFDEWMSQDCEVHRMLKQT